MKYEIAAVHDLVGQRGAGVLVISGAHALLCQRGDNADNPGTWAPFGGMVDPGESTEEAARRELGEEAGLWLDTELIHLYDSPPTEEGFVFSTYVTFVEGRPLVDLEREESSGYGWFSPLAFPAPRHPGFNAMLKSDEWRALVDSLDLGDSLDLMPGEDRLKVLRMKEEARIKGDDEYNWFKYKGADIELPWRHGKTETLFKGEVFGVRWSSNGKSMRLIIKRLGTTRVFTIDQDLADTLRENI